MFIRLTEQEEVIITRGKRVTLYVPCTEYERERRRNNTSDTKNTCDDVAYIVRLRCRQCTLVTFSGASANECLC